MEASPMKTKMVFLVFSITALIMTIILIVLEVYYAAGALIVGMLIIGHRELWSLIRRGKMPPVDERVKENINKSIRNSFIFFGVVSILIMLLYITDPRVLQPDLEYFLGGLLLSVGIVYVISYLFYDRVETNLDRKGLKTFRTFLLVAGISLAVFIINAFFNNAINRIFNIDYLAFHRILLYVLPFVFAVGIIGSLVVFIKGLFARSS